MVQRHPELEALVQDATRRLPATTEKAMFGCQAWFRDGKIFALVWKEGRIGVKLPDDAMNAELHREKGAEPWTPGGKMTMSSWVLVPSTFHKKPEKLNAWIARAHSTAGKAAPTKAKKAAPTKAKKAAPAKVKKAAPTKAKKAAT